jgi:transposase
MSLPKQIIIKESFSELKELQRKSGYLIAKRIQVLIEFKKNQTVGISKRDLSDKTGINHNSITKWRNLYLKEGIHALLIHGRIGFKKSIIDTKSHKAIEKLLNDPKNGIRGYKELQQWITTNLHVEVEYSTLVKYSIRHFGTKIKVARKSHVKKDEKQGEVFKKTLVRSVPPLPLKQKKPSKG